MQMFTILTHLHYLTNKIFLYQHNLRFPHHQAQQIFSRSLLFKRISRSIASKALGIKFLNEYRFDLEMKMIVKVWCFVVLSLSLKCVVAVGESQATTRQQRYTGYSVNNVNQNDYISKIFGTVTGLQSSNHEVNQKLDEIDNK